MAKKKEQVKKIGSRKELKDHLSTQHRKGSCSTAPEDQLERGGWTRKQHGAPTHLMGGAAIVCWKYTCPNCGAVVLVEMD